MTNGAAYDLPPYYNIIHVAKYLNVPPWELINQPHYWINATINVINADNEVQEKKQKKAEQKSARRRR